nr:hypothetical protein [Streptomyces sp. FT05W]
MNAPDIAAGCKLTGGSWRSAYDNLVVNDAGRLDVDHFLAHLQPLTDDTGTHRPVLSSPAHTRGRLPQTPQAQTPPHT